MALTSVSVTGTWLNAGLPMAGTVTFTLLQPITNGSVTITATPRVIALDSSGSINVSLQATDDPDTTPTGVWYGVTEQLSGAQPRDYFIQVSAADAPTVDLTSLIPTSSVWW